MKKKNETPVKPEREVLDANIHARTTKAFKKEMNVYAAEKEIDLTDLTIWGIKLYMKRFPVIKK